MAFCPLPPLPLPSLHFFRSSTRHCRLVQLLLVLIIMCTVVHGGEVREQLEKVGDRVSGAVNDIAEVKSGQLWCPIPAAGTQCPPSSPFHYYRCCGPLNNECCLSLQTWAFILLVAFGVGIVAVILLSVLRCVFCRRD